jgi:hypothetical protein
MNCALASAALSATAITTWSAAATSAAVAAATSAVAATTSTAAIATAAAVRTTAATSAATTWACFTWPSFVYSQGAAFDGLAVEFRDRFLRVCFVAHGDESEPARFAGELVLHEGDFLDSARLGEKILEIGFGCVEGKISYV